MFTIHHSNDKAGGGEGNSLIKSLSADLFGSFNLDSHLLLLSELSLCEADLDNGW